MRLIEENDKKEFAYDEYVNIRNNNKYLSKVVVIDDSNNDSNSNNNDINNNDSNDDNDNYSYPIIKSFIIIKKLKIKYNLVGALSNRFKHSIDGKDIRARFRKRL